MSPRLRYEYGCTASTTSVCVVLCLACSVAATSCAAEWAVEWRRLRALALLATLLNPLLGPFALLLTFRARCAYYYYYYYCLLFSTSTSTSYTPTGYSSYLSCPAFALPVALALTIYSILRDLVLVLVLLLLLLLLLVRLTLTLPSPKSACVGHEQPYIAAAAARQV